MMPLRLTAVLTHPVQYYSAWFRSIATTFPAIDLTVLYIIEPTRAQQGTGFEVPFEWDVPLREGYRSVVLRAAAPGDRIGAADAWLPAPTLGPAIVQTRPDVVLIFGWYAEPLRQARAYCRAHDIPVMVFSDSQDEHRGVWGDVLRHTRSRLRLRGYDALLVPGQRGREYLLKCGAAPTKIFRVPHTVDATFFGKMATPDARAAWRAKWGAGDADFVVLFAGKFEPKKRPHDAIAAVADRRDVLLVLAGDGELRQELEQSAKTRAARVVFTGFLNQTQLAAAYAAADCLVLPSNWQETWGLVVNEALTCGIPVVVSDQVGCGPDLAHEGATGARYRMGDGAALAGALDRCRTLTADPATADRCRALAAAHSHAHATAGLFAAMQSVVRAEAPVRVVASLGGMVSYGGLERMTVEVLRVVRRDGGRVHAQLNDWENHRIAGPIESIGGTWRGVGFRIGLRRSGWTLSYLLNLCRDVALTNTALLRDAAAINATHLLFPDLSTVLRSVPAVVVSRLLKRHVVVRVGTAPVPTRFYQRLWRITALLTDVIGCNSQHTADRLAELGVPTAKLRVIRNVVAERALLGTDTRRDPYLVAFVGQLIPGKGVHLAIAALRMLLQRGVPARMVIAGDLDGWMNEEYARYRDGLQTESRDLQSSGVLTFLGWREDVPSLLQQAAVLCCPSVEIEGGPGVILEAKAAGTPTVAFDIGPLRELVRHGQDGWLCSSISVEGLADGLARFVGNNRPPQVSHAARTDLAERFSHDRFAAAWMKCFDDTATA